MYSRTILSTRPSVAYALAQMSSGSVWSVATSGVVVTAAAQVDRYSGDIVMVDGRIVVQ